MGEENEDGEMSSTVDAGKKCSYYSFSDPNHELVSEVSSSVKLTKKNCTVSGHVEIGSLKGPGLI